MINFELLELTNENNTSTITLNRPKQLNALNQQLIQELSSCLHVLENDNKIKSIIITGSGNKAFVAGADIKEFANFNTKQGEQLAKTGQELLFNKIEQLSKPVIAAVNGFALGGGLELALACHFRIASNNAKLGLPEVTLGLIPGYGGTQRLPKLIGKGLSMQAICTAQMFTAAKAAEIGLVNEVVEQENLMDRCLQIANQINQHSSVAIAKAIAAINAHDTNHGYQQEITSFGELFGTEDFTEGTTAFLEKRKPKFL